MVDEYKGYQNDKAKFERLGIVEGVVFQIKELNGYYVLDLEEKEVYETYPTRKRMVVVKGLYQNLLRGAWHKKIHGIEE